MLTQNLDCLFELPYISGMADMSNRLQNFSYVILEYITSKIKHSEKLTRCNFNYSIMNIITNDIQ